ncbi:hypothetical protein FNV43_RR02306 [Rhamnella rubrinervis]|uniref:F-box domain-containing protein n=1 Tax=Rhamnella rubrinervis TaxID=2594499 RepID=A0A8K0HTH4_9ROSA|nr:hypothetical protein FNV43_RR02306 [Rhamnella rubrinervis]
MELDIWVLPEECIAHIISLTSPRDACCCTAVSSKFRSVAESDTVWVRFLPSYWEDIVSRLVSPVKFSSKKALYFHLCHSPIFIDQGNNKSFTLEKVSGIIRYMLGSEELLMLWNDVPIPWNNLPVSDIIPSNKHVESRFLKACLVEDMSYLQIRGRMKLKLLSPNTAYEAFLIYLHRFGEIEHPPMKVSISVRSIGKEGESHGVEEVVNDANLFTSSVFSTSTKDDGYGARKRGDGWMEVKMGEFFTGEDDDDACEVEMRLWETTGYVVHVDYGLVVQGIELRPKE